MIDANQAEVRSALLRGRKELDPRFGTASSLNLRAGETFASPIAGSRGCIYRLRRGWAGQCQELAGRRRAIVDVYLPGDLIGLDAACSGRPGGNVLALASVDVEPIDIDAEISELLTSRFIAFYVAWLLGRRQRRADRLLTAMSCLDARGRMAMMILDFYKRLHARGLAFANTYNMPLTQHQIGEYLGITVVHVNRVLRSLRDERVASLEKNCLMVLDLDQLSLLAQARTASDRRLPTIERIEPRRDGKIERAIPDAAHNAGENHGMVAD
jgi:CRP-like cAMP-binding protein